MKIITGSTGTTHVTSNNDGEFNQGIFGDGLIVFTNGKQLNATVIDNNTIRIEDGDTILQGRHALIEPNTTEDITIETGTIGMNRNDLIVERYVLDTRTGYESCTLEVVKGKESSGVAVDPELTTGDIRTGSKLVEVALYRVKIEGVNIVALEKLFTVTDPIIALIETLNDNLVKTNSNLEHCYSLKNATRLAQETDLHDLIDYKNYYCNSANDAVTMKNCPIDNQGFTYRFERTTGGATGTYGLATIIANNGSEHIAVLKESVWSDWVCTRTADGKVPLATALATERAIRTNLASTSVAQFDGTANINPGVQGVLPLANGGTGQTTAVNIIKNVLCNSGKNEAPEYVFGFNSGYEGGGYTTIKNLKETLGAATKVYGTLKEPTSYTDYGVSFVGGTDSGDKSLMQTTGFIVGTVQGTTSAEGRTVLTLGNNKAAGENGNKYGAIAMYDTTANRVVLKPHAGEITATRTFSFPNKSGVVAVVSDLDDYSKIGHAHSTYLQKDGGAVTGNIYPSTAGSHNIGTSDNPFSGVFTKNVGNRNGILIVETSSKVQVQNFSGTAMPITASAFTNASSRKVKENIVDITDDEAKKLLDVDVVSFDYIDKVGGAKDQYGVIAEEVYKQIPFAVIMPENYDESSDDIDNIPMVDYSKFVPYLIKMIQIQQEEINELKERIK